MWHIHPQQQQRGVQFEPSRAARPLRREAHAHGEQGRTLCDMTGARQQGFARPRGELATLVITPEPPPSALG